MTAKLHSLEEWCRSAEAAALAAEVDAQMAESGYVPPPVEWLDPGPDPFGMDWVWTQEEVGAHRQASEPVSVEKAVPKPTPAASSLGTRPNVRPNALRYTAYAIAATLLIGLGIVLSGLLWPTDPRGGDLALKVNPTVIHLLGSDRPQPTIVSPLSGFVTVIGVTPTGDVRLWPTEGDLPGRPVPIQKDAASRVGPLAEDVETVVAVVTEQPATAALLQEFRQAKIQPDRLAELEQRITTALRGLHYRHVALGRAEYRPKP